MNFYAAATVIDEAKVPELIKLLTRERIVLWKVQGAALARSPVTKEEVRRIL